MARVRMVLTASFSSGDFSLDTVSPVVSGMVGSSAVRDSKVRDSPGAGKEAPANVNVRARRVHGQARNLRQKSPIINRRTETLFNCKQRQPQKTSSGTDP